MCIVFVGCEKFKLQCWKIEFKMNFFSMAEHGAALQTYNQELVKCLESMRIKRDQVKRTVNEEEMQRVALEKNIKTLQERLNSLNKSLNYHKEVYESYNKVIRETENGFKKIIESSETLLRVAQHEVHQLTPSNSTSKDDCTQISDCND